MTSQLYWRKFTRNGEIDQDSIADEKFLAENFTDFFGRWLQQGDNTQIQSYDGLVMSFWGCAVETGESPDASISGAEFIIPMNHFYDQELLRNPTLMSLLPDNLPQIVFKEKDYDEAAKHLRLSLLQTVDPTEVKPDVTMPWWVLGGDKRVPSPTADLSFKILLENKEGLSPFNILHASIEDAVGIEKMQTLKKVPPSPDTVGPALFIGLFSANTFNAIMMVDFWNPIYSWRRGCLMQYVPTDTVFDGKAYDLDARFIENVKKSQYARQKIEGSPEYELIKILDVDLKTHQDSILMYFQAIQARMKENPVATLQDYLTLAESRRRIYRPLPLDEFGPTMPFALALDPRQPLFKEMAADGTIQNMPDRGKTFLLTWTHSLSADDPQLLPQAESPATPAPLSIEALPKPATLSLPCQSVAIQSTPSDAPLRRECPFLASMVPDSNVYALKETLAENAPNWADDVLCLIKSPYWVTGNPEETAKRWMEAMQEYEGWSLDSYDDVKLLAVSIYQHLRNKSMPITRDPQNYWPDEALETFRSWANSGFPRDSSDSPVPQVLIPKPVKPRDTFRVRKDIMSLSKQEIAEYQAKLDDVLQVDALGSKWQELGDLHANWCPHYQEATLLWHRAYLLYVEKLVDFPIPYWNTYATETACAKSPLAGIPPMFLDDTYIHPADESVRPNPLRYALSLGGKSKDGSSQFVTRNPVLVERPSSADSDRKIGLFKNYHEQISRALKKSRFTSPDAAQNFGKPWGNIPDTTDNQSESLHSFPFDFHQLIEQVNDNFHRWVGPDMADNSYTAFDPIFLSFHSNMDRLAGTFIDAHPENQFTSNFPLQPFINSCTDLSYNDPRLWRYTTIGDVAKDTRSLGYMYGAPAGPDAFTLPSAAERGRLVPQASGGRAMNKPAGTLNR
ncbi:uncharacterized protein DNG_03135 [Cephalotrichum gorgonifer]|uniref:tyrosinase n=1 Tax=Cephalotrichum gorgonifer TaxID=2041049 RepID=A0AAE8STA2_9PEZI|nr:uncharacterized protein DNG_03135 [Cephalotrichum gorgonifer]